MSVETLHRAARLMRARASVAEHLRPGPWVAAPDGESLGVWSEQRARLVGSGEYDSITEHIASWHPNVALGVAEWLDDVAIRNEAGSDLEWPHPVDLDAALTIALLYLGGDDA